MTLVCLSALLCLTGAAPTNADTLIADVSASPLVVRVGERVRVRVAVARTEATARLIGLPAPTEAGPMDVVLSQPESASEDSLAWGMEVAFFQTGDFDLSSLPLVLESSTGRVPVRPGYLRVSVEPSLPAATDSLDIQDVTPPVPVPVSWRKGRVLAALAGLAIALAAAVWWWRRREHKEQAMGIPLPGLPPEAAAALAFRELAAQGYPRRGKIKQHYAQLSWIVREYLERRGNITALESTTAEIIEDLRSAPLAERDRTELDGILSEADLVKFAKANPGAERAEACLHEARTWVERAARVLRPAVKEPV